MGRYGCGTSGDAQRFHTGAGMSDNYNGGMIILILVALYFTPTIIAFCRRHHYCWVIFVVNLVAGWTLIGLLVTFIWAVWPRETALSDPFHGDPVSRDVDAGRAIYHRRNEYQVSLVEGEHWYYSVNRKIMGPVHRKELLACIIRRDISPSDLVWKEGMSNWMAVEVVFPVPRP